MILEALLSSDKVDVSEDMLFIRTKGPSHELDQGHREPIV